MKKSVLLRIRQWADDRIKLKLLEENGGIQWCPWCNQCMQEYDDTHWTPQDLFDIIECGNCHGTSKWVFTIGMLFVETVSPPPPKKTDIFKN